MSYYGSTKIHYILSGSSYENLLRGNKEGLDKVKQNLLAFMNTSPGERFFRPNYGCNLERLLFHPNDFILVNTIKKYLLDSFSRYFSELQISNLSVETDIDALQVRIYIEFYTNICFDKGVLTYIIDK